MSRSGTALLIGFAFLVKASTAFALTNDDILPQALIGKTLTFTIESASGPILKNGSWTVTFQTWPPRTLVIENVDGNSDYSLVAYSVGGSPGQTGLGFNHFYDGSVQGTILLSVVDGVGQYVATSYEAVSLEPSSQTGTFTIPLPEIEVSLGKSTPLADGLASIKLGKVKIGKTGTLKTIRITNTGDADLTGLAITKSGTNKSDFIIGKLGKTTLIPGDSTRFTVKFKPRKKGARSATIRIASNDADENPFDIKLTGKGAKK